MSIQTDTASVTPRVSVILPVYNDAQFVAPAVRSILDQSFSDFELIAIDDGSSDNCYRILQEFELADPRVKVFWHPNRGLGPTLNRGISIAKGELIARQDADDQSHAERLAKQVKFLDAHPEVVLLGCFARVMDVEGRILYENRLAVIDEELRGELKTTSPFIHGAVMMRASQVKAVGGYRDIVWLEDLLLWRAFAHRGELANLAEALYDYRVSPTNLYVPRKLQRQVAAVFSRLWPDDDLSPADFEMLEMIRSKITPRVRRGQYHLNLAKGLMLNNGNRQQARHHIKEALQISPFSPDLWFHLILSLLPSGASKRWRAIRRG